MPFSIFPFFQINQTQICNQMQTQLQYFQMMSEMLRG